MRALKRREVAHHVAFVAQETSTDIDMTAAQVVMLGRAPHHGRSATTEGDIRAVEEAMTTMGVRALADRSWSTLSGGERQRVNIAGARRGYPGPSCWTTTNHLDVSHRLDLMERLSTSPTTVVAALHELDLAARYCDHLVLLDAGRVIVASC
ncbi:ABC transporter ATP-binding protein OS=Streptomyces alboniger OX=132473 GN=CP975_09695 PE=4 SV=1 [Streptomyces alboniger]